MGSLATRIKNVERALETGGRGLMILFVLGTLEPDLTGEHASIIGDNGATFHRRASDESPSAFQERMKRDALCEHALILILGGLPPDVDQRLLDAAEGEA